MKYAKLTFLALAAVLTLPVFADGVVDDVVKLAQGNASEDVIVAWVERAQSTASLSVTDILRLKDAKVPDRAIAALIRSGAMANGNRYMARDEQGRMVDRENQAMPMPQPPPQQQMIPASQTSQVTYVDSQPSTTYVTPQYSYVYSDSYPVYYGGAYWPRSYGYYGGYGYGGYGYGYPGFGLSLNFGHGGYYGGYGHSYYGGGHGGSSFRGGYSSGGYSSGGFGGGHSGFSGSGGFSGGHSGFSGGGGFSGGHSGISGGGGSHGHR